MDISASTIVSFLLTIFSTSLTIITNIPSTSSDHLNNNIPFFRAVSDRLQNSSETNKLFAMNVLHENIDTSDFQFSPNESHDNNLAKAVILYNENPNNNSKEIRSILNCTYNICDEQYYLLRYLWSSPTAMLSNKGFIIDKSLDLEKISKLEATKIWFTNRSLNLENPTKGDVNKEDNKCVTPLQNGKCTYTEISNIKKNISSLDNSGYLVNFHNEGKKIHSIQEPIKLFVSVLNHFFLLFVIAGPNIFLIFFKRHLDKSNKIGEN